MENLKLVLEDAKERLENHEYLSNLKINHIEDRYFSRIYEITGTKDGYQHSYILKISTTARTCENEYNQYVYLDKRNIKSLIPILYSNKYNYMITQKEYLIEFDKYLKKNCKNEFRIGQFFKLGKLFKVLDERTGEYSTFKKDEYENYVLPRLIESTSFSRKEKELAEKKVGQLTSQINNNKTRVCFVSDFALGNIHLNDKNEFVLLDMGDAGIRNLYENISSTYLNIKFGSLQQFFENRNNTKLYFNQFVSGHGIEKINKYELALFMIKHLVNMINFLGVQNSQSPKFAKRILSLVSDKYLIIRYKKYLFELLRRMP